MHAVSTRSSLRRFGDEATLYQISGYTTAAVYNKMKFQEQCQYINSLQGIVTNAAYL